MNIPRKIRVLYNNIVSNKKKIIEIIPIIMDEDYKVKFIDRYFTKNTLIKNSNVVEISEDTYNKLNSWDSSYPYEYYDTLKIVWKLIGPLETVGNVHGVRDTNKRSIIEANLKFPGIDKKLINYIEFARITPAPIIKNNKKLITQNLQ